MDNQPRTRQESKKSAKDKKHGHNKLGSSKGTRQKEALIEKGLANIKDKQK